MIYILTCLFFLLAFNEDTSNTNIIIIMLATVVSSTHNINLNFADIFKVHALNIANTCHVYCSTSSSVQVFCHR